MTPATLGTLAWLFIYGGLLAACLGIAAGRAELSLATPLLVGGGVAAGVGFALIYARSRMRED